MSAATTTGELPSCHDECRRFELGEERELECAIVRRGKLFVNLDVADGGRDEERTARSEIGAGGDDGAVGAPLGIGGCHEVVADGWPWSAAKRSAGSGSMLAAPRTLGAGS